MNDKEYTYDIGKYTIGVDTNGEDEIGMTVAKVENGEINFLGNCYGENARCLDLLIKENQELKKQLEEYENEPLTNKISRIDCVVSNIYSRNKIQQKEFINYLENMLDDENDIFSVVRVKEILQKYKEIIGE